LVDDSPGDLGQRAPIEANQSPEPTEVPNSIDVAASEPVTEPSEITESGEVLRRQVVVSWIRDGSPLSVAFRPTPKDERRLSTDKSTVSPAESFGNYDRRTGVRPGGTWGVSVGCILTANNSLSAQDQTVGQLRVLDDGGFDDLHQEHASIVFSDDYAGASVNRCRKLDERLARELKNDAIARGRMYPSS
jgi:hypothetical protein